MAFPVRTPGLLFALAVLAWVGSADAAHAGWVTLKNDTNRVIVVQESVVCANGTVKRGRPIRLFPGETLREFQAGPTVKRVEVFDWQALTRPLFCGNLTCKDDNQTFSVASDGKAVTIVPAGVKMPEAAPTVVPITTPPTPLPKP